jgi:hypothetical protein
MLLAGPQGSRPQGRTANDGFLVCEWQEAKRIANCGIFWQCLRIVLEEGEWEPRRHACRGRGSARLDADPPGPEAMAGGDPDWAGEGGLHPHDAEDHRPANPRDPLGHQVLFRAGPPPGADPSYLWLRLYEPPLTT